MPCACCVDISHYALLLSIKLGVLFLVRLNNFNCPDNRLLLELHALTLDACSYHLMHSWYYDPCADSKRLRQLCSQEEWKNAVVCVAVSCLLVKLKREGKSCMVCDTSRNYWVRYWQDCLIRTLKTSLRQKDTTASFAGMWHKTAQRLSFGGLSSKMIRGLTSRHFIPSAFLAVLLFLV